MAIQIADGFQLRVSKPLDDRQNVETVAQLDPTYGYEGQIVYVKDIKQFYTCYKDENGSLAYKVMETGNAGGGDLTDYQEKIDDTLTTTDKTIVGAINEVKDSIITNYKDLTNKPSIAGVELDGNKSLSDLGITIYDDTEVRELIDTKISKPETDGTAGQILVLQDDGSLAYADNVTEYDDTEIQEAVANKLDKPEVDGTTGQILVLQDDGSLAYADNVNEFDDTEIQEELDTKLDKEKVVQNLDAPDAESVLSTEALNTVLDTKVDKVEGSSLVPDTEISKIHEHSNQDVLDKLSDDGNGKLLYDSNPISADVNIATVDSVGTVKPDGTTITIANDGTITAVGGGGTSEAEFVSYDNESLPSVTNVEECLDAIIAKIYYVNPSITSFTCNPSRTAYEMGEKVTSVTFTWTYNKDMVSQTLTGCDLADETVRTATYSTEFNYNKIFTLGASDGTNSTSANKAFTFQNKVHYGSASIPSTYDSAFILSLNGALKGSKGGTYTTTVETGKYFYIAMPTSFNNSDVLTGKIGGFDTDFGKVATVSHTNASGYTCDYNIYKSTNHSLGSISFII